MTKKELAGATAKKVNDLVGYNANVSAQTAESVINAALEVIKEAVYKGDDVTLRGFGTFTHKNRAAKTARNINTGEAVHVPARSVVCFKPAADFTVAKD